MKARAIAGTITLTDGTTSYFSINGESGWQQWGAPDKRLGASVDIMEAMTLGLYDDGLIADPDDDNGEGEITDDERGDDDEKV